MKQKNKNTITLKSFDSFIMEDKKSRFEKGFMGNSESEKEPKFKLDSYINALIAIKNQILAQLVECGERIKATYEKGGLGGQKASMKYEKIFDGLLTRVSSMLAEAKKQRESGRKLKDPELIKNFREDYKVLYDDTQKAIKGYTSEKNEEIAGMTKELRDKELISPMGAALKAFKEADELASKLIYINSMLTGEDERGDENEDEKRGKIDTSNIKIENPIKQWTGGKGSETVKKVQQLIYDKFKNYKGVGDQEIFKLFVGNKEKFPDGKNGKNTSNLIVALKKGFGLEDTTPDITQEFVDKLYTIKESLYINEGKLLSFNEFISIKENFNLDDFKSAVKSFSKDKKENNKKENSTGFTNEKEGNAFREWVNKKYPKWAKKNKLDPKGPFDNSYIRKAWKKFKDEYKNRKTE